MTARTAKTKSLDLTGLDGANPLGFLAAIGTLVSLRAAGEGDARLRWTRSRTWVAAFDSLSSDDPTRLSEILAGALRGHDVPPRAEQKRTEADRAFENAGKAIKRKREEIKIRGLKSGASRAAIAAEMRPLEQARDRKRKDWLQALRDAVPRPELALGDRIDCTDNEYREHAGAFCDDANRTTRDTLDLLAAFGSDACQRKRSDMIEPTPFCFISGGGHQDFLSTIRQLIAQVNPERVRQTLFNVWAYTDEKLSMRWDPIEDRRYALMDRDPTASDNKSRTVWMANLLAYRGLALFTCAPTRRGLGTTAWMLLGEERAFTWPIWEFPASPDVIRSLLQLEELTAPRPDRPALRARGLAAVFRAHRIRFPPTGSNYKLNFSPARGV